MDIYLSMVFYKVKMFEFTEERSEM